MLEPPINLLRLTLHPDGMAPRIINFEEYATQILHRVRRRIALDPSDAALGILAEFGNLATPTSTTRAGIALPMQLRLDHGDVRLVSTLATFGSPLEVSLSELAIDTLYPADPASKQLLETAINSDVTQPGLGDTIDIPADVVGTVTPEEPQRPSVGPDHPIRGGHLGDPRV